MSEKNLDEIGEELAGWIASDRGVDRDSVRVRLEVVGRTALRITVTIDGADDEPAEESCARLLSCGANAFKILTAHREAAGFLWEVP